VDGLQRAFQPERLTQFLQAQIGFLAQEQAHLALMATDDPRFAPGQGMARRDRARAAALLEEFLTMPSETRKRRATSSRVPSPPS
jgi:hypothetical protein